MMNDELKKEVSVFRSAFIIPRSSFSSLRLREQFAKGLS